MTKPNSSANTGLVSLIFSITNILYYQQADTLNDIVVTTSYRKNYDEESIEIHGLLLLSYVLQLNFS